MAKGNRRLYKVINKKTGTFYITSGNRVNNMPAKLKKFDPKSKNHEEFIVKKMK